MHWIKISCILCMFGCFKDFRPSEPFMTDYLTDWKHFDRDQVNRDIFPFSTYGYLATLIIVFLVTDFVRYKPVIILCGLSGIITFLMIIFGETILIFQILEFLHGLYLSTEVAYYTYIYAKVDKSHYQEVTSHTKAAVLFGRSMSAIVAQLTTSFSLLNYHQLNYLTVSANILATIWAFFLPSVKQSIYFHRASISDDEQSKRSFDYQLNEPPKYCRIATSEMPLLRKIKHAYALLWKHFLQAYTDYRVVKWSIWWALASCGYVQVISYTQLLWQDAVKKGDMIYNGAVDFLYALIGAGIVFCVGKMKLNWRLIGDVTLSIFSFLEGIILVVASYNYNIWFLYAGYIIFGVIYHSMVTVASFEVAKYISEDSYGLIFGINMFFSLIVQSLLTFVVVSNQLLTLNIRQQAILSLSLAIGMISAQCLTGNDFPTMMDPTSKTSLPDARIDFALDSLKKAALIESKDNIFFSPHSIHQALTLAYFGARGTTESSLKQALRIPERLSKVEMQRYYAIEKSLNQLRPQNESTDYEYKVANKFWITNSRKLRDCMFNFFGDQMQVTDFRTNPAEVRTRINDWVSNMTKGHIRDLLPPNSISGDTDLVLANAAYFKGLWAQRFDPKNSKRDIFYASGTQNSVITYMRQKGNFNHLVSEDLGVYILELPYKGNDVSMFVLLPPFSTARDLPQDSEPQDGIRQLVERLATEKGSRELRQLLDDGMPQREVEVNLPRFEIERELQLNQLLYALGAGELLSPGADLRGFVADGESSLHLGDAVHRARIEVTEEGTTAAAATAIFTFRSSRPTEPAIFNANHPFVYLIYDKHDRTILFAGIFRSPANSLASGAV